MNRPQSATFHKPVTAAPSRRKAFDDRLSLLRLSAVERLFGAAGVMALLWAAVYWALN
ncbi:hypothetical protein [Methylosinus sp. Ce-a6]|uniref:hypothetical protein n=1 Tax=Methylosinus sp. Ce-a6 TaxID=2172005 RepID=UPI00135C8E61|nr:hypothetical protein [Methylosinus sp. Ce-a6]